MDRCRRRFLEMRIAINDPLFYLYNDSSKFHFASVLCKQWCGRGASTCFQFNENRRRIQLHKACAAQPHRKFGRRHGFDQIYETISSIYMTIISDSVIVKSASGAWTNYSRAGNSYNASGDWFYRQQSSCREYGQLRTAFCGLPTEADTKFTIRARFPGCIFLGRVRL